MRLGLRAAQQAEGELTLLAWTMPSTQSGAHLVLEDWVVKEGWTVGCPVSGDEDESDQSPAVCENTV